MLRYTNDLLKRFHVWNQVSFHLTFPITNITEKAYLQNGLPLYLHLGLKTEKSGFHEGCQTPFVDTLTGFVFLGCLSPSVDRSCGFVRVEWTVGYNNETRVKNYLNQVYFFLSFSTVIVKLTDARSVVISMDGIEKLTVVATMRCLA